MLDLVCITEVEFIIEHEAINLRSLTRIMNSKSIVSFLAAKGAALGSPMCGVSNSVLANMQIYLSPFKYQLFHLSIVDEIPSLYSPPMQNWSLMFDWLLLLLQ